MVESVWDYPRPPRVERSWARVVVELDGVRIADTRSALRVLETSHPPVFYVPLSDVAAGVLRPNARRSLCEFKGYAAYHDVGAGTRVEVAAAWSYPDPLRGYEPLLDHVALYPGRMDACFVDDERVVAQPGDFYGGWITSAVAGPFKGGPGTAGW